MTAATCGAIFLACIVGLIALAVKFGATIIFFTLFLGAVAALCAFIIYAEENG